MNNTLKLGSEKHIHFFDPDMPPAIRIQPNTRITVDALDALEGRAFNGSRKFEIEDVNPATGPIFVEGAEPGDVLAVRILTIRPVGVGYAGAGGKGGALGDRIPERLMRRFDANPEIRFSDRITLEAHPSIGVIGVAPPEGRYSTMDAGDYGGNLDCNLVCKGATVHLPVAVEGGLLALGDVHAVMGDGEVGGQGIETAAEVELEIGVMKDWPIRRPLIETDEVWATVAAASDFETAAWTAVQDMVFFIATQTGMEDAEAFLLVSLAGQVRVCQIVTPMPTARVEFSKRILR